MILIIASAIAEEEISITISSGAFFNEVPEVIVYEKSIPLIYTQKTIIEEENNVDNLLEVENYCEKKKNSYCYIVQQSLILLKTLNININENKNLEKLAEIVGDSKKKKQEKRHTIHRRFLQFLL